MSPDLLSILFLSGLVFAALALAVHWVLNFTDLLWMQAIRPYIVGPCVLISVLLVSMLLDHLVRRQGLMATRLVLLLVFAPILAVPLSNLVARWRDKVPFDRKDPLARAFIFKRVRQKQQDDFVASLAPLSSKTAPASSVPGVRGKDEIATE